MHPPPIKEGGRKVNFLPYKCLIINELCYPPPLRMRFFEGVRSKLDQKADAGDGIISLHPNL